MGVGPAAPAAAAAAAAAIVVLLMIGGRAAHEAGAAAAISQCDLAEIYAHLDPGNVTRHNPRRRINGDIVEGPGPPCRPPACNPVQQNNQCLDSVNDSLAVVCQKVVRGVANKLRMPHCCEHQLLQVLPAQARHGEQECLAGLEEVLQLDTMASLLSEDFRRVLARYDCPHGYSVVYNCGLCETAYRAWVCASLLGHHAVDSSVVIRPCRTVCHDVERACPFFLPGDRAPMMTTQYAGEPTFLCLDPFIPETGEQLERSMFGEPPCCYEPCSLYEGSKHKGNLCQGGSGGRILSKMANYSSCKPKKPTPPPANGLCPWQGTTITISSGSSQLLQKPSACPSIRTSQAADQRRTASSVACLVFVVLLQQGLT